MIKPAMEVIAALDGAHLQQPPTDAGLPGAPPRGPLKPPRLEAAFVTRMSHDLNTAVASAAKSEGLTAGAWVRRLILDRLALASAVDRRSGRPVHRLADHTVILVGAIRALGDVGHALSSKDIPAARISLTIAREALLPLVARGPAR